MKYMGNKRAMLQIGLGLVLKQYLPHCDRFVDLFSGSGSVAIHVATNYEKKVLAIDLQSYSAVLSNAVLSRDKPLELTSHLGMWKTCVEKALTGVDIPISEKRTIKMVKEARQWCSLRTEPITRTYGGHYFSPLQAMTLDALLGTLPKDDSIARVAHAAIINAASHCAASPGHTAQPFQPTITAKKYLFEAWDRDVMAITSTALTAISSLSSKIIGEAKVMDAQMAAKVEVGPGDLCFLDPPYSGVHYSRFYHVLETIAVRSSGEVSGVGRYPAPELRPKSDFSLRGRCLLAMQTLLEGLAAREATCIITFPNHACSNGLSGEELRKIAGVNFDVEEKVVNSKFSSLGGTSNPNHRSARVAAEELILILRPSRSQAHRSSL